MLNVSRVIRLNEAKYDRTKFIKEGISHTDMFFIDGSNPSEEIVSQFLNTCEAHFS